MRKFLSLFGIVVKPVPVLNVGDRMQMNVAFIDTLQADPLSGRITVVVRDIKEEEDGTKSLILATNRKT